MFQFLHEFAHIILIRVKITRNWLYYLLCCFLSMYSKNSYSKIKNNLTAKMVFWLCIITCSLVTSFIIVGNLKCSELFIRLNNVVTLEDLLQLFLPFIYKIKTRFLVSLGRNMSNCSKEFYL